MLILLASADADAPGWWSCWCSWLVLIFLADLWTCLCWHWCWYSCWWAFIKVTRSCSMCMILWLAHCTYLHLHMIQAFYRCWIKCWCLFRSSPIRTGTLWPRATLISTWRRNLPTGWWKLLKYQTIKVVKYKTLISTWRRNPPTGCWKLFKFQSGKVWKYHKMKVFKYQCSVFNHWTHLYLYFP